MSDTNNPTDLAQTLGEAVHSALTRFAGVAHAVQEANRLLDAGDTDKAILYIRNARAPLSELASVESLIYACLPRTGDGTGGQMG